MPCRTETNSHLFGPPSSLPVFHDLSPDGLNSGVNPLRYRSSECPDIAVTFPSRTYTRYIGISTAAVYDIMYCIIILYDRYVHGSCRQHLILFFRYCVSAPTHSRLETNISTHSILFVLKNLYSSGRSSLSMKYSIDSNYCFTPGTKLSYMRLPPYTVFNMILVQQ